MKIKYLTIILVVIFAISCKDDEDNTITGVSLESPSFSGKKINTIAVDNEGTKWIGASDGLYRFDGTNWNYYPDENLGSTINHIFYETTGGISNLLISTDVGAVYVSIEGTNLMPKAIYKYSENSILSNKVKAGLIDEKDKQWFGTDSGVCYQADNIWTRDVHRLLPEVPVTSMTVIDTNYYVSTTGYWLYRLAYDDETDAITGASQLIKPFNGNLTTINIYCVYAGSEGYLWFGSEEGLTRQRDHTKITFGDFTYYLEGEHVHSVLETGQGDVWAGTENGVFMKNGDDWTQYATTDGLANNTVNALSEDPDGSIWMGTNNGLSHFDGDTWTNY